MHDFSLNDNSRMHQSATLSLISLNSKSLFAYKPKSQLFMHLYLQVKMAFQANQDGMGVQVNTSNLINQLKSIAKR